MNTLNWMSRFARRGLGDLTQGRHGRRQRRKGIDRGGVLGRAASAAVEAMESRLFLSGDILPMAAAPDRAEAPAEYVPGELLVIFADGASAAARRNAIQGVGGTAIERLPAVAAEHWRLGQGVSVDQAVAKLAGPAFTNVIEYAEPNYIVTAADFPSDPLRGELWGMHNIGQTGGTKDADVDALEAWSVCTGSASVVVGVIDTGIDYTHPDLAANIWTNPGEIAGNGIDDDHNGFVDDVHGWDFVNNDNDPMDDNGHGTHTAGTIGAVGDNGIGVVGVNWTVSLMALKFLNASGTGTTANAIAAINYAASFRNASGQNIVRITNNSWGGGKSSMALQSAINASGALFVAAAGNSGSSTKEYPAAYALDNIISVAATDQNDALASFSNYSTSWVDLGAPGVNVLSTTPSNTYSVYSGTSMATPHVAGAAALKLANTSSLTNAQVKAALLDSVDKVFSLSGKALTGGRLNVGRALGAAFPTDVSAPGPVTDLIAISATDTSITLGWTATGDDDTSGSAYLYDVRYSLNPISSETDWSSATKANGEPIPKLFGSAESFTISGLSAGTRYYVAMKVFDEAGNAFPLATVEKDTNAGYSWQTEIVDPSAQAGLWSALAYDRANDPAIGYSGHTPTSDAVGFAHWNGASWDKQWVASGFSSVQAVDLAYDPRDGFPSLSYSPQTRRAWDVRFAHWNGSSWVTTVIQANAKNAVTSLVYDQKGNASISYCAGGVKLARQIGETWETELVAPGSAYYSSLAYDSANNPSIAYLDDLNSDGHMDTLLFVHYNGTTWDKGIVRSGLAGSSLMAISLAYDPTTGQPAIAYGDGGFVGFIRFDGSKWGPPEFLQQGYDPSFTYRTDGAAFLSYRGAGGKVVIAQCDPITDPITSTWTTEIAATDAGAGYWGDIALDANGLPSASYSGNQPVPLFWDLRFVRKVYKAAPETAPAAQQDAAGAQAPLSATQQKLFSIEPIAGKPVLLLAAPSGDPGVESAGIAVQPALVTPPKQVMQVERSKGEVFLADEISLLS